MTLDETKAVLAYIAASYPRHFANGTQESAEREAITWYDTLGEYSLGAVMTGVKSYNSANNSGFPPDPGQIVHYIHFIGCPADRSGTEAWALVRRAVNCPWDQMGASFLTLPEAVRKAVGSAASLKELAMMDSKEFETVAQSNFLRMYEAEKRREATERKLPSAVIAQRERLQRELDTRHAKAFGIPAAEEDQKTRLQVRIQELDDKISESQVSASTDEKTGPPPEELMERFRERMER